MLLYQKLYIPLENPMSNQSSVSHRISHLLARRANKREILDAGGQQALAHSERDIQRIDYALRRIEEGQYGLCCNCGAPIAQARLDTIPEAPLCTPCAQEAAQ